MEFLLEATNNIDLNINADKTEHIPTAPKRNLEQYRHISIDKKPHESVP
jgi:hypothetical protein